MALRREFMYLVEALIMKVPLVTGRNRRAKCPVMADVRVTIQEEPENENVDQSFIFISGLFFLPCFSPKGSQINSYDS